MPQDLSVFQIITQFGLPIVLVVYLGLYIKAKIEATDTQNKEEKNRLINRLDFKDTEIERKNEKIEKILTGTVAQAVSVMEKVSESHERLVEALKEKPK